MVNNVRVRGRHDLTLILKITFIWVILIYDHLILHDLDLRYHSRLHDHFNFRLIIFFFLRIFCFVHCTDEDQKSEIMVCSWNNEISNKLTWKCLHITSIAHRIDKRVSIFIYKKVNLILISLIMWWYILFSNRTYEIW